MFFIPARKGARFCSLSLFPHIQEGKDVLLVLARTLAPRRGAAQSSQPEEKRTEQQQWKNFNRVHLWFLPLVSPVPRGRVQPSTVDREPMAGDIERFSAGERTLQASFGGAQGRFEQRARGNRELEREARGGVGGVEREARHVDTREQFA